MHVNVTGAIHRDPHCSSIDSTVMCNIPNYHNALVAVTKSHIDKWNYPEDVVYWELLYSQNQIFQKIWSYIPSSTEQVECQIIFMSWTMSNAKWTPRFAFLFSCRDDHSTFNVGHVGMSHLSLRNIIHETFVFTSLTSPTFIRPRRFHEYYIIERHRVAALEWLEFWKSLGSIPMFTDFR